MMMGLTKRVGRSRRGGFGFLVLLGFLARSVEVAVDSRRGYGLL